MPSRTSGTGDFGNWELSANRANAARRALVAGSYPESQVARVVGYASSALFDREHPFNPVNRRIDIVVLTKKAQRAIEGAQGAEPAPDADARARARPGTRRLRRSTRMRCRRTSSRCRRMSFASA